MADELELVIEGPGGLRRERLAEGERLVLGRGQGADLRLDDAEASRRHVAVERTAQGWRVTDLGSRNGTALNEGVLAAYEARDLPAGGTLRIGAHRISLAAGAAPTRAMRDDYQALHELGRGAAGVVHAALHRASGRRVAIKQLDTSNATPAVRQRFLREAELRVESPCVVQVYEVRPEGERVFLVLELLEGGSLEDLLAAGPLPHPRALAIAEQVARGLAAAHSLGVVHRDVKPANILLTAAGRAKLGDFGIAKELGSALTVTGQGMGTLAYVAPEQAEDAKRAGPSADLYALGATLYHMLGGRPPFAPQNAEELDAILDEDPQPLCELRPDCPPAVASLVHRLLEKEPCDRVPDALMLANRLSALRG